MSEKEKGKDKAKRGKGKSKRRRTGGSAEKSRSPRAQFDMRIEGRKAEAKKPIAGKSLARLRKNLISYATIVR